MTTRRATPVGAGDRLSHTPSKTLPGDLSNFPPTTSQDQLFRPLRALGYTRVSTDEQETRPEDDDRRIRSYCAAFGHAVVDVLADRGVSGRVPLTERDHGARVARLLTPRLDSVGRRVFPRQREADVVVVTAMDRLTRSTEEGLRIIRDLAPGSRANPVRLISLDDGIDLTTAAGRLNARLRLLFSEFERELIGERIRNAALHRRSQGRAYAGKVAPYGWDVDDGDELVPNEVEQTVIEVMRMWRATGVKAPTIARHLNEREVVGKTGRPITWQAARVNKVLEIADAIDPERAATLRDVEREVTP